MSQLVYHTRGNSTPHGKPRVYFCCHPADQKAFLDSIVKEILSYADCSVWYAPEGGAPCSPNEWEEREAALSQMQLFVLPVTARLLTSPSPALEREFPFAVAQHIPVLPILMEPGLEALFNQKCGDLQCLDPNQTDPAALPYTERLKNFLDAVLIGDKLAAQIRDAFDAYIFLSYRKKDRREAQSLMRLIHASEFCRDIAIWYDEFLTPGENFNQAIAKALEKSHLFVLAVTPHLLEHPNYVMQEEFPAAQNSGKPILPVEMIPASRTELEAAYPGIPPCTSGRSEPALSEELKAALQELALRENDNDPKHIFFIGLAYLNGIDVEVDKERAVPLIQGAADAGLNEAMEKLVTMYSNGDGVTRDYRQAAFWQRRLADTLRTYWEATPNEHTFQAFAKALWDLGDQYADLDELTAAGKIFEEEFFALTGQGEKQGIACAQRYQACGYSSLGNLYRRQGNMTEARCWLKKSAKLRFNLSQSDNTIQIRRDTVESQIQLGALYREENDDSADIYFRMAAELSRGLVRDTNEVRDREYLALSCEWLDDAYLHQADTPPKYAEIQKLLEESQYLRRTLNEEIGSVQTRRALSSSYIGIGNLLRDQKDIPGARRCYEESLTLYRSLAEETQALYDWRNLAMCHCRLGIVYRLEGNLSEAHRRYQAALSLLQDIANRTGTVHSKRDLVYVYRLLGSLCRKTDDPDGERQWLEASVSLCRIIVDETDHPSVRNTLARDLYRLGRLPDGSAIYLYQAAELWNRLSEGEGSASSYAEDRQNAVIALAEHDEPQDIPMGLKPDDYRMCKETLALSRAILTGPVRVRRWRSLAAGYLKMGVISRIEKNNSRACYWFHEGLRMMRSIAKDSGMPNDRHALAMILYNLGSLPHGDSQLLHEAAELWTHLAAEYPSAPQYIECLKIAATLLTQRGAASKESTGTGNEPDQS